MTATSPLFTAAFVWLAVLSLAPAHAAEDSPADGAPAEDCGQLCRVWHTITSFNAEFRPSDYGHEPGPAPADAQPAPTEPSPRPKVRLKAANGRAKAPISRDSLPSTGPSSVTASAGHRSAKPSRTINALAPAALTPPAQAPASLALPDLPLAALRAPQDIGASDRLSSPEGNASPIDAPVTAATLTLAPLPAAVQPASGLPQGRAQAPAAGQALPGSAVIRPAGFAQSPNPIVKVAASPDQASTAQKQP